jgi:hypothetical protein
MLCAFLFDVGETGVHGPTPVICLILNDEHAQLMRIVAEEVKSRGAKVYVITDDAKLAKGIDDSPVIIPNNGPLTAIIGVLPLQVGDSDTNLTLLTHADCALTYFY